MATSNLPWRHDNQDISDALEIESHCGAGFLDVGGISQPQPNRFLTSEQTEDQDPKSFRYTFYVCPKRGLDKQRYGNQSNPFRTLQRAVGAVLESRHSVDPTSLGPRDHVLIVLESGIHFLDKTILLKPQHSFITLRGNGGAWLSGGILIPAAETNWKRLPTNNTILFTESVPVSVKDITGLFTVESHKRLTLARYPNANVEHWDERDRYEQLDTTQDEWIFPPIRGVPDFSDFVDFTDPSNPTGAMKNDSALDLYNKFGTGRGGACSSVWGNYPSYWCGNVSAGGWANVDKAAAKSGRLNIPTGMILASGSNFRERVQQLWNRDNAPGAIFHVAHTQGWAWHMFNVSRIEESAGITTVHFDQGGQQGSRNWQCHDKDRRLSDCNGDGKRLQSGPWYVEGVLEELDAPGEFFFDGRKRRLYLIPEDCEGSGTHGDTIGCSPPDLVATNLKELIRVKGTKGNPVRSIRLENISFRDAAKTYMDSWAAPSGGDWALHRGGAIHVEGTDSVEISGCRFQRLDGNAIMLGGYQRNFSVTRSEFSWLGESALATWGDTDPDDLYNATGGDQTRGSLVEHNVMSNLGLYQKQSSGWGQNKACQNTIRRNVMFNLPRAAINFNDGLGGGNLVESNVIFNACRESGDHGPINSWDRMPFLTDTRGVPSFSPLPTHTQGNLIWANYGASEGFDNDDGSSFYYTHDNVFYEADGFKMDYGGHSSKFTSNLVYSTHGKKCFGTGIFKKENGEADSFTNNTCIIGSVRGGVEAIDQPKVPVLGALFQCELYGMNPSFNQYFTSSGQGLFDCGNHKGLNLQDMHKLGFEKGSTLSRIPASGTILGWAREVLQRSTPAKGSTVTFASFLDRH